ncbi:MAG: aminopeptidase N [Deltaproteobacteria bacterium]|nr:MAG: aminopeptidase N [Deltaproteobacteria bacterium]
MAETPVTYLKDYQPPAFRVLQADITAELAEDHALIRSCLTLLRQETVAIDTPLILDGRALTLLSISINGDPIPEAAYHQTEAGLTISPAVLPEPSEPFTLETTVRIHPAENTSLEGLYASGSLFCTQCEAQGFRKITFYPDRPDVMATFTCRVIADREKYPVLLSNGNLIETGDLDNGRHFALWKDPFPKPSYLFALVAGDLACIEDTFTTASGREIILRIYTEHANADQCDHAMASLKKAMKWDEDVYGLEYDLDLYLIVAVGDFNMGAMENKGLNIFNTKYVLARPDTATDSDFTGIETVIAHEYFHNWTGNRVTLKNWFQLSLKEGLTVFRDQEFSADMQSRAVKRISDVRKLRAAQFPEDAGPMAHPIRPDAYKEMNNFYTATVYDKGAEVIRMIHRIVGSDRFRKGMDLYFERFDGQAVTCEDFLRTLADASGEDLSLFWNWYIQSGTPEVQIDTAWDRAAGTYTLSFTQSCPDTPGQTKKQPFHIPVAVGLIGEDGLEIPIGDETQPGTRLIHLKKEKEHVTFNNLTSRPTPSLFRGFSAPVRVRIDVTETELAFLLANDTDPFARWEAGQQLTHRLVRPLIETAASGNPVAVPTLLVDTYASILSDTTADPALIAQLLSLPSETELGNAMADAGIPIDPDAIHRVRNTLMTELAQALLPLWRDQYQRLADTGPYELTTVAMGRRSLKNQALFYLTRTGTDAAYQSAFRQFETADNMTDALAALTALTATESPLKEMALTAFEDKWQADALVMDKWFTLQATAPVAGTLDRVIGLMDHPSFSIKNPNKVRSLIGAFCAGNPWNFHQLDGRGYAFLGDRVLALNRLNPQMAARMVSLFNRWKKFDAARQALMKSQLERIAGSPALSADVQEIVEKALI